MGGETGWYLRVVHMNDIGFALFHGVCESETGKAKKVEEKKRGVHIC